ncbi:cytochrome P450 [Aspergillus navahoensis]
MVTPGDVPNLEILILAGEPIPSLAVATWADKVDLLNAYGPAECSIIATVAPLSDELTRPMGELGMPVGQVFFVTDPVWLTRGAQGSHPGRSGRLYRTGDLVRYCHHGSLSYIGRVAEDAMKSIHGVMINHWLTCFSFDMMGELGYNNSYTVIISPLPWLARILSSIVGVPSHLKGFMNLAIEAREERKAAMSVSKPDVLSQVFDGNVSLTAEEEIEDTMLLQIEEEVTWENIKSLPLSEAAINETLPYDPAPGAHLRDLYIPGNTTVSCPTWTIQMDPANFTDPTTWNPHRWINHPAQHKSLNPL